MEDLGSNYVAFLDLVAFKAIVEADELGIQMAIARTLEDVDGRTSLLNRALGREEAYRWQLNGDAVVITLNKESSSPVDLMNLLDVVRAVQAGLFERFGLLMRGGISYGRLYRHGNSFTGSGMSRASDVLGQENPSFLIGLDDRIVTVLESWLGGMYPRPVADRILSERIMCENGHSYVRWVGAGTTADTIRGAVTFYQSQLDGPDPKIVSRIVFLIEMYNKQNTGQLLTYRMDGGFVVFE